MSMIDSNAAVIAAAHDLARVRAEGPLVHNITNYVVMNTTANAVLAVGGSPIMAHAVEEVEELVGLAQSLVVNIGTLSAPWVEGMFLAGRAARGRGIPVVLDPVGAGASRYRTETARRFLAEIGPTLLRGNASEIRALVDAEAVTRGVDSQHGSGEALAAAEALAGQFGCVVAVTGAVDAIVTPTGGIARVHNGHPLMGRITGMGCSATAITGAFAGVSEDPGHAAVHALAVMGVAGEQAGEHAAGPGSFAVTFLDALAGLDGETLTRQARIEGLGSGRGAVR